MAVNQLKAGAALNYVVLGLSNLVGLLYTPYMLRMMGQSEYGLYSLVASVIAYLTIMDFGFGNAIIRYTAKFRAEGKLQEQYSMFGMFLILYSIIGVIAFLVGLGLYFNIDSLFGDTMTDYDCQSGIYVSTWNFRFNRHRIRGFYFPEGGTDCPYYPEHSSHDLSAENGISSSCHGCCPNYIQLRNSPVKLLLFPI